MLAIRLKRTGRKGHAQFRVIVQDSHFHPTRGRVVAYLGSYNPHTKTAQLDKDLVSKYLGNGAQPSDRVARLLQTEGIKLPDWVKLSDPKQRTIRNPEKLRRNRPAEEPASEPTATEPSEPAAEGPGADESTVEAESTQEASVPETSPETEPEAPAEPSAETPVEDSQESAEPEA